MTSNCPYCGEKAHVEIFEVFSDREFILDCCCEKMQEEAARYLENQPKEGAAWLRSKGLDEICGLKSRRIIDDHCGNLIIDWNLEVVRVTFKVAKEFVTTHHRHCTGPVGWRFGAGITNGTELIGVIMCGRPLARMIDHTTTVEVNRLCIRTDIAQGLAWNACSKLYGWAAKEAKRRGFQKIMTYTLESESGSSLMAAGWAIEGKTKGGSWSRTGRQREDKAPICAKNRWSPSHKHGLIL